MKSYKKDQVNPKDFGNWVKMSNGIMKLITNGRISHLSLLEFPFINPECHFKMFFI